MKKIQELLSDELHREAAATRRLLERVPQDKHDWRPHPKSSTLGGLAGHIAAIPRGLTNVLTQSTFPIPTQPPPAPPAGTDLVALLEENVAFATKQLAAWSDEEMAETWSMVRGDTPVLARPRHEMFRTLLLNHWYHHRGQLSVYLRLLDISVPSTYGPSADEPPMF